MRLLFSFLLLLCFSKSIAQKNEKVNLSKRPIHLDTYWPKNWYLFDSLLLVEEVTFGKMIQKSRSSNVRLVYRSKDSTVFYISTHKTFIVNNSELTNKGQFFILEKLKLKRITFVKGNALKRKFNLTNQVGAYVINVTK